MFWASGVTTISHRRVLRGRTMNFLVLLRQYVNTYVNIQSRQLPWASALRSGVVDWQEFLQHLSLKVELYESAEANDFGRFSAHRKCIGEKCHGPQCGSEAQPRFVARGPKRPEDEAKLFALRTKRVHRSLATPLWPWVM